MREPLTQMYFF